MRTTWLRRMTHWALALGCIAMSASHGSAMVVDGPGRYFVVRTLDTGRPASPAQHDRCLEHFGSLRENTIALELDAELFSFPVDQANGRVDDRASELTRVGPGFLCAVPSPDGVRLDTYGYAALEDLATPLEVEFAGPCDLAPVPAQPGAAFFNCKLDVLPDLTRGILGGFATSNSVVNPRNAVPGNPTGSVWTFYVIEVPNE